MHIWSLALFLAQNSYQPWNFLSYESDTVVFHYVNEVPFGPGVLQFMGLPKSQTQLSNWTELNWRREKTNFLQGGERGWRLNGGPMADDVIN